ncbi:lysylphosphatidylglycerol synthase transmembrane domain-containing protein [Nocardiopsis sp. CNT312]|uniref:lysylphosphatidylglycerol synthase transmembrane domain-containing protein n=1 Tax=Nocardiopsis sp. CNT312 TaxID=1137268 RepID=UPI0004B1BDFB|nr:lysylphosphatidylglycerol synthase transmembrane domain-containing protein [Nocardiopsis sp. CNT312]
MNRSAWLRALAGAAVLAAVAAWFPSGTFAGALALVDGPALLAALAAGAGTTVLSAARWWVVARGVGLRLPFARAVGDYYRAVFLNAVLPAGVLGDAHRAVSHGRYAGDLWRGVRAVVLERVAGQLVLMTAAAGLLFALPTALFGPGLRAVGVSAGLVAAVVLTGAAVLFLGRTRRPRWWRALRDTAADTRAGLVANAAPVLALSVAALTGHVALFVYAASLAGTDAPVVQVVPLAVLSLLAMSVPVNVGGWGPREAVTALAFAAAGLGSQTGVTVSVVYGVLALAAALPGAVVPLVRWAQAWRTRTRPVSTVVSGVDQRPRERTGVR